MEHAVPEQILIWADAFLSGTISDEDKAKLEQWYKSMPDHDVEWDDDHTGSPEALRSAILNTIRSKIRKNAANPFVKKKISWYKYAAAVILLVCGTAVILYQKKASQPMEKTEHQIVQQDVPPGAVKAMLILANGQKIVLDSAQTGELATQEGAVVSNRDGTIVYDGIAAGSQPVYNTLTTGRAEQSPPLTLADGTKVWLNAASSIYFPTVFTDKTRAVTITGEAYLEVAPDPLRPFTVRVGKTNIEVLGTHFNVMAYDNEEQIKTTLLEGSVKITDEDRTATLRPGEELQLNTRQFEVIRNADVEAAIAWKNGWFVFKDAGVETVMKQVERWYNISVRYEGKLIEKQFNGRISRSASLSELMEMLSFYDDIKCTISGNTITIKQ